MIVSAEKTTAPMFTILNKIFRDGVETLLKTRTIYLVEHNNYIKIITVDITLITELTIATSF